MLNEAVAKPIGRKAYGSIGHLPGSRMEIQHAKHATGKEVGKDFGVHPGAAKICTEKVRDRHDRIIVQEKLDGSCCAVALVDGVIHPIGRAGWPSVSSPYLQHRMFHDWVRMHEDKFRAALKDGERMVGEWLAQAHGTRYELWHQPFAPFDIMTGSDRMPFDSFCERIQDEFWVPPNLLHRGPLSINDAIAAAQEQNHHKALDAIEGVVYRVERRGVVEFLAKYVRPEKVDGCYLPEVSGGEPIWNWQPGK